MSLAHVGLILPDGISNFGTNTLATQLVKLGIKGFALNKLNKSFDKASLRHEGLELYDNFDHLSTLLTEAGVTTLFVISKPIGEDGAASWKKDLLKVKEANSLQLNLIWCERNPNISESELRHLIPEGVFDKAMCFYNRGDRMWTLLEKFFATENILSADFDIWDFSANVIENVLPRAERENVVLYAGRFTNSKGTNTLIDAYESKKLGRYRYSLEGGGYGFSGKSGKVTGSIGVIQLLVKNKDIKVKDPKECLSLNAGYEDFWNSLTSDKMNIYPPYSSKERDADRRRMSYFITPILSGVTNKGWFLWQMAPEYVFYESLEQGLPIVCSRQFAETMHVNGRPLIEHDGHGFVIFDGYEELEDKLDEYEKDYDQNVQKMLKYWIKSMDLSKKTLVEKLNKFIVIPAMDNPKSDEKLSVSLFD